MLVRSCLAGYGPRAMEYLCFDIAPLYQKMDNRYRLRLNGLRGAGLPLNDIASRSTNSY